MKNPKELKLIKPENSIVNKSESWLYKNPVAGVFYWNKLKSVFDRLKKRRWGLILEIGCEYGFFLPSLCQISDRVIGSDIKSNFDYCEKITLEEMKKSNANLELKSADATHLSDFIAEKSCDAIVAISVLEHIDDYDKAIKEVCRCLKPSGTFVCVLPSENRLYRTVKNMLRYVATEFRKHYNPHKKEYDPNKIRASLRAHFMESEKHNCPFGLPLIVTRVYVKREDKHESNNVN